MNGLNDFAENVELRADLRQPFPAHLISKLPATQKRPALDYVNHAVVTDRLNSVAPGWTMSEPQVIGFTSADGVPHCMAVVASMTIGNVTRWEVGEADGVDAYGREVKGAISDWIRRAAMRFGVAIDLWTKADLQHSATGASTATSRMGETTVEPNVGPDAGEHKPTGVSTGDGEDARPATAVGSPESSGLPPDPETSAQSFGEGVRAEVSTYLSKDDQGLLKAEYGGQVAALKAYKAKFGERITRLGDITYDMRDQMNEVNA